ncbi:hypothetical protein BG418_34575 [Streptomyces sp. CBMA152]|nr:hypothetical protein [Streptomyces sp. CBMA152]
MTCGSNDTYRGNNKKWLVSKYGQITADPDGQSNGKSLCLDATNAGAAWGGGDAVGNFPCSNDVHQTWNLNGKQIQSLSELRPGECLRASDDNTSGGLFPSTTGWWYYWGFSTIGVDTRKCSGTDKRQTWTWPKAVGADEQPRICWSVQDDNPDTSPRSCFLWAAEQYRARTGQDYLFKSSTSGEVKKEPRVELRKRQVHEADVTLIISVQEFGSAAAHIRHATTVHPDMAILTLDRNIADAIERRRQTRAQIRAYRQANSVPVLHDVDEWPMAMFAEGGTSNMLSLMHIDRESNRSLGSAIANALAGSNPAGTGWPNGARVRFVVVDTNAQADELSQTLQAQNTQANRTTAVTTLTNVTNQQQQTDDRTYLSALFDGVRQQITTEGVGLVALAAFAVHSNL